MISTDSKSHWTKRVNPLPEGRLNHSRDNDLHTFVLVLPPTWSVLMGVRRPVDPETVDVSSDTRPVHWATTREESKMGSHLRPEVEDESTESKYRDGLGILNRRKHRENHSCHWEDRFRCPMVGSKPMVGVRTLFKSPRTRQEPSLDRP